MTCPHLLLLSQLADGELPAEEASVIREHVVGCDLCAARMTRIGHAMSSGGSGARRVSALGSGDDGRSRSAACPSPSLLAGWRDAALPTPDRTAITRHLETCDACLGDALGAALLIGRLDASPRTVPSDLKARVAAMWPEPEPQSALSSFVVRVTRAGAELLESHVLAPLRDLVELPTPQPAMRADTTPKPLSFALHAQQATITTTVVPSGESVALSVLIADDAGAALADQRVFLRRHGRSIYSARTDGSGTLRLPGLERAVYEVMCPGIGASFRLDLRN